MVSLVRLMLFTTTVEILKVRTGSVQSCHQTPIFPYRGRARQTSQLPVATAYALSPHADQLPAATGGNSSHYAGKHELSIELSSDWLI